jgi:intracellular multiplication protein IcmO
MAQNGPNFRVEGDHQFIDPNKLRRDITPVSTQLWRFLTTPMGAVLVVVIFAVVGFAFPGALLVSVIVPAIMMLITKLQPSLWQAQLPLRLPLDESENGRLDYGDPKPQHRGLNVARGAFLVGTAWRNREEVWGAFTDMLTHCLVIGGTGAGKTEQLVSMEFNALACVGGAMYVDPKGGPKLFGQHWTMARFCGRDDDMRILNFALGQEDMGKTPFVRSNTLQPFAFGKAESLKEIPLSLMSGGDDKGSIFSSNGKTLMTGLMMGLVDLRKMGEIYLTINDIRTYINADKFIELAQRKDISLVAREAMLSFLTSLGWKSTEKDHAKWGDFDRQYSYAQNYFLDTLSVMSDTYRHIFNVPIGDINMVDIILNRRMFLCVIPSLEKSKKELANLGKISLAVIRLATSVGLGGGEIMGNWKELVDLNISASEVPSFLFVDEYAAIAVDGFAEVFTQGRSLGISATVGSQDWAGIKKANEAEAQQIVANTKLKFIMTTDDPNDTRQLVNSLADSDDEEMRSQGFSMTGIANYYDTQSAQAVKAKRINNQDLSSQVEGEWHLFFKNRIIRGFGFFAGGIPDDENFPLFVHHLMMVERPKYTTLSAKYGAIKETIDRWVAQIAATPVGTTGDAVTQDYAGLEGCKPLGDVFIAAATCNSLNEKSLFGLADKQPFSIGNRRELACAAVYSWMEEKTASDEYLMAYAAAVRQAAAKKLAPPVVSTSVSDTSATDRTSGEPQSSQQQQAPDATEGVVVPTSVLMSEGLAKSAFGAKSAIALAVADSEAEKRIDTGAADTADDAAAHKSAEVPSSHTDKSGVEDPDDLLSMMEQQMGVATTPAVGPADVGTTVIESVQATTQKAAPETTETAFAEPEKAMEAPGPREDTVPNHSDVPNSDGQRMATAASAFAGLSQFMEETVVQVEKPLKKIVKGSSQETTEENRDREATEAVTAVKQHMLQVLTEPPYPSPPTPEPMETSKFRSMAERWIHQVKSQ